MPVGRKSDERWAWTECMDVDDLKNPQVEQAYLLSKPVCQIGSCRTNCRANPRCLCALGLEPYLKASCTVSNNNNSEDRSGMDVGAADNPALINGNLVGTAREDVVLSEDASSCIQRGSCCGNREF